MGTNTPKATVALDIDDEKGIGDASEEADTDDYEIILFGLRCVSRVFGT